MFRVSERLYEEGRKGECKMINLLTPTQVYKKVVSNVVYIENINNDGKLFYGSGFIYDDKTIVTAGHVVNNANLLNLFFYDGSVAQGTVKLIDQGRDLATITTTVPINNKIAKLGDITKTQIGDKIMAIGAPFKFKWSLTFGIVSQIRPEVIYPGKWIIKNALQTDIPVNKGNSGGPIFNQQGQVLGIASFVVSSDGDNAGVAFCNTIPEIVKFIGGN